MMSQSEAVCKECTNHWSDHPVGWRHTNARRTNGILDGSQDLAGVNKDDHGGIHEQLGIIPVFALLLPLHCVE